MSNNLRFTKCPPLNQGLSKKVRLLVEKTLGHVSPSPPFAHTCGLLLWSTVPKQESNVVSVRPSAECESKHESLSAQDLTSNSLSNLLNIKRAEEEIAVSRGVLFLPEDKARRHLDSKTPLFPSQSTKCKSLAHQRTMPEQAVLHLIMNCIPSLDRDLLDSFLASPRKYALHLLLCPKQTPSPQRLSLWRADPAT